MIDVNLYDVAMVGDRCHQAGNFLQNGEVVGAVLLVSKYVGSPIDRMVIFNYQPEHRSAIAAYVSLLNPRPKELDWRE